MEDASKNATVAVVILVLCGLLAGYFLGSCGEAEPETVVQTVAVTETKTVRKTKTKTVTETVTLGADGLAVPADTTPTSTTGEDCSEDYAGACVPLDEQDVSCADLGVDDIDVIGSDVYGLDPDEDGLACEQTE